LRRKTCVAVLTCTKKPSAALTAATTATCGAKE